MADDEEGGSSALDLHTLLAQALGHSPTQQPAAAGAAKGSHDPAGAATSAGQAAGQKAGQSTGQSGTASLVSSAGSAAGVTPIASPSAGNDASSGSGGDGASTATSTGAQANAASTSTHTVQPRTDLAAQLPPPASPLTTAKAVLSAPVGTAHWTDELGQQLIWMAHQNVDAASLHVSPAGLGPIEARIAVQGGTASVWFGATHPDTRAALEQALPRLRAMFATQGMSLADSGVFREAPQRRQPAATSSVSAVSSLQPLAETSTASARSTSQPGLVDLYA